MAKKMSTGKVVALALCVIVGAGSIAALARGRDKDDEKEPAHVHDFSETNICADCGERQESILFTDVKVGMDLSGYSVRLTIPKEEFEEQYVVLASSGNFTFVGYEEDPSPWIDFNEDETVKLYAGAGVTAWELDVETEIPKNENIISFDETGKLVMSNLVLDERFSNVYSITDHFVKDVLKMVEFYYVGLEEATATAARFANKRAPKTETVSFWDSVNVSMAGVKCSEWTPIF